ncbi:snare-associated protein snapin [Anaeramoeba flamelloides]|uniref:Snare-associated protein snapin n=1 Tax=Anaeramoeba flamelloides TaxID=1746091 RepID=A0ABQ8X7F0_9EUKA|nr:snare-associated protein snapin [Anaeramoeba flamelloides]
MTDRLCEELLKIFSPYFDIADSGFTKIFEAQETLSKELDSLQKPLVTILKRSQKKNVVFSDYTNKLRQAKWKIKQVKRILLEIDGRLNGIFKMIHREEPNNENWRKRLNTGQQPVENEKEEKQEKKNEVKEEKQDNEKKEKPQEKEIEKEEKKEKNEKEEKKEKEEKDEKEEIKEKVENKEEKKENEEKEKQQEKDEK